MSKLKGEKKKERTAQDGDGLTGHSQNSGWWRGHADPWNPTLRKPVQQRRGPFPRDILRRIPSAQGQPAPPLGLWLKQTGTDASSRSSWVSPMSEGRGQWRTQQNT